MILGSVCTRACSFCNVATGKPDEVDPHAPEHVAEMVTRVGLNYTVISSFDRHDLDDCGARHSAHLIEAVRRAPPNPPTASLTPDVTGTKGTLAIQSDDRHAQSHT